jgi:hypothetical protein
MFVPHRKHKLPLSVTGIALLIYMCVMFVPHRKHKLPLYVTEMELLIYMQMMFVPHRKHLYPSTACYTDSLILFYVLLYEFVYQEYGHCSLYHTMVLGCVRLW